MLYLLLLLLLQQMQHLLHLLYLLYLLHLLHLPHLLHLHHLLYFLHVPYFLCSPYHCTCRQVGGGAQGGRSPTSPIGIAGIRRRTGRRTPSEGAPVRKGAPPKINQLAIS